jgi:hypothetical protein
MLSLNINHYHEPCRFRAIFLSYVTQSLSDDPVLSISFLGGPYPFFRGVDTVLLVFVSGCVPFCLRAEANLVGTF